MAILEIDNIHTYYGNIHALKGISVMVEKGEIVAKIKIEITLPATITAVISSEAVGDLNLQVGEKVEAVVKATEVMVAKKSNL